MATTGGEWTARRTRIERAGPGAIEAAVEVLRAGGLVAFPTETVYGLGADAASDEAVARIFEAKRRPAFNPLIAHVASLGEARRHGLFNAAALALAHAFWPGPLTLVVPAAPGCKVALLARAGLDSVALRVPAHPLAHALLERFGGPVAAPSANMSGAVSPTCAAHVIDGLSGRIDMILDGGDCAVGLESSIVSCLDAQPRLLRPGGVERRAIERALLDATGTGLTSGQAPASTQAGPLAPGMLASHYAPRARVRLNASHVEPGEAALDFAGRLGAFAPAAAVYLDLSPHGDCTQAAASLFAFLRRLDATGADCIAVAPVPDDGLGEAINDRLRRAAADR